jgi:arylsulfatase A-like enzyme
VAPRDDALQSLVVVTLDTTRADFLGCYGNTLGLTPRVDALAARGTLFEHVRAPMPLTLPSHAALFTGLEPRLHGALDNRFVLPEHVTTLAEVLGAAGFATGGFIGALVLSYQSGIAQGFDAFDQGGAPRAGRVKTSEKRGARAVTDAALRWARDLDAQRPFFLWAHYYDPHVPLEPPAWARERVSEAAIEAWVDSLGSRLAGRDREEVLTTWRDYAAEIVYADAEVGRLLDGLARLGLMADTAVILAADHGEGLFEHGERGHQFNVYEELVRVPLVVCEPLAPAAIGRRVALPVTLADAFPTALHLALGRPASGKLSGRDLVPLLRDGAGLDATPLFVERPHLPRHKIRSVNQEKPEVEREWGVLAGVVHGGYKLIENPGGTIELYDLTRDPAELDDLAQAEPERAALLQALLRDWLERHPTPPPGTTREVSAEQLEALRALGYLGDE